MRRHGVWQGAIAAAVFVVCVSGLWAAGTTTSSLVVNGDSELRGDLKVTDATANSAPTNGLILYYSFSTNATLVADDSGNGHTGMVAGATWGTNGITGGAREFNGSSNYVEVSQTNGMNFPKDRHYTLSAWIYQTSETGGRSILAKQNGNPQGAAYPPVFAFRIDGGHLALYIHDGGFWESIQSAGTLSTGTWYHVVAEQEGTSVALYTNGVQDNAGVPNPRLSKGSGKRVGSEASAGLCWPMKTGHFARDFEWGEPMAGVRACFGQFPTARRIL